MLCFRTPTPPWIVFASLALCAMGGCAVYDPMLLPLPRRDVREASAADTTPITDVMADTGADTGIDTGVDSGIDTGVIADGGIDTGVDTVVDTGVDVRGDTGVDVRTDTGVGTCGAPQTMCGTSCVDLSSNVAHCGSCFNACPMVFNGTPQCQAGRCVPMCAPPASPYDQRSCVFASSDACPATTNTSRVPTNSTHVRFYNLARTPANNLNFSGACATLTGADQTFALSSPLTATWQVEFFTESFNGGVALRPGSCVTPQPTDACANNSSTFGRELVLSSTVVSANSPLFVVAKDAMGVSGPFAIAATPTAACTNRALDGSESCDDGDLVETDGCSSACGFTATTLSSCAESPGAQPIVVDLGTQTYRVTPSVSADTRRLPCGMDGARDFVTFVRPVASGNLEVRTGLNEAAALYAVGCAGAPLACAPLNSGAATAVTAGTTYALVVDSPLRPLEFSLTLSRCGNGTVEGNEQCDDGNALPGDGCNALCGREASCQLSILASTSLTTPARPPFTNCTVVPLTGMPGAATPPVLSHNTRVVLAAGDRVSVTMTRTGGSALIPWGVEILPESAAPSATAGTTCNVGRALVCANDAGSTNNSATCASPAGGAYIVRVFSQGSPALNFTGRISVQRYPTL